MTDNSYMSLLQVFCKRGISYNL